MHIYLSQHGKCFSEDEDPERRLTDEGKSETGNTGKKFLDLGLSAIRIIHSGKTRALETADIFAGMIHPAGGVRAMNGMNPNDGVELFAEDLVFDDTLIVGHLPFMEKLASYLVTGNPSAGVVKFRNSCIVILQKGGDGEVKVLNTLLPDED